jgi:hypothetical protein
VGRYWKKVHGRVVWEERAQDRDPGPIVNCRKEEQEIKTDIETRTERSKERGDNSDSYKNISPQEKNTTRTTGTAATTATSTPANNEVDSTTRTAGATGTTVTTAATVTATTRTSTHNDKDGTTRTTGIAPTVWNRAAMLRPGQPGALSFDGKGITGLKVP